MATEGTHLRPLVVGIAGGSGSGKSTVVRRVKEILGDDTVAVVHHDAYYRNQAHLSLEERAQINFDHPDSLETELLVSQVRTLLRGEAVEVPTYDFTTHLRRSETERVAPHPVLILDGILILAHDELRQLMDLKVFVDTKAAVRLERRIRRDMRDRGRTRESVVEQFNTTVRPMHVRFVEPSKRHADILIPEGGYNRPAMGLLVDRIRELLGARGTPPAE
jgi:uridine kinase